MFMLMLIELNVDFNWFGIWNKCLTAIQSRVNLLECNLMEQGYSMANIICSCQSTVNMIKTCLLLIEIA